MNISSNISSMQSHQQMLNVNASNVANVNSNTDLTREIPSMMVSQRATEVNTAPIKTQDQMIGTLLDMKA